MMICSTYNLTIGAVLTVLQVISLHLVKAFMFYCMAYGIETASELKLLEKSSGQIKFNIFTAQMIF